MSTATRTKKAQAEQDQAREFLRQLLPPGTKLYTLNRHTSRSGMRRHISVLLPATDERTGKLYIRDLSWSVAEALGWKMAQGGGIKVTGCGMDMGFHLVNVLSYALHGHESKGRGLEEGRQGLPMRETDPENYRAGYTLEQEWL